MGEIERGERREAKQVLGIHWELQGDGGLWKIYWHLIKQRGAGASKGKKAKGHGTQQQVEEGKVRMKDKDGNDNADEAANIGVQFQEGLQGLAGWL